MVENKLYEVVFQSLPRPQSKKGRDATALV